MRRPSPAMMPLIYGVGGGLLMAGLAWFNSRFYGVPVGAGPMVVPVLVGLVGGLLLGAYRKKWMEKSLELKRAAAELDRQLDIVKSQRMITDNLQRLVESIPLPVALKDLDHRYLLCNERYRELSGKAPDDIRNSTDFDLFSTPVASLFRDQDQEVLNEERAKTYEETIPLARGVFSFQTFKFPLRDATGRVYALGSICADITETKKAEDRLAVKEARFDAVLRQVCEGVIATNADGNIVLFNRRAARLTDCRASEVLGKGLDSLSVDRNLLGKGIDLWDRFGQDMGTLYLLTGGCDESGSMKDRPSGSTESSSVPAAPTKGRILVMDDDSLVRRTSEMMLGRVGYSVVQAAHGEEAVQKYRQALGTDEPIDAVIMDLTVPGAMGGVEATQKILALDPEARIIVASGYSNDPVMANFQDYGFTARVGKPFAVELLKKTMAEVLEE